MLTEIPKLYQLMQVYLKEIVRQGLQRHLF